MVYSALLHHSTLSQPFAGAGHPLTYRVTVMAGAKGGRQHQAPVPFRASLLTFHELGEKVDKRSQKLLPFVLDLARRFCSLYIKEFKKNL